MVVSVRSCPPFSRSLGVGFGCSLFRALLPLFVSATFPAQFRLVGCGGNRSRWL
ncbi:unnamed protein product [Arabis nemorensis]|uniref:Uncharacterized protein n=1 Tax=Arabis nemorensis TaxID=586526 RepID=A0A565ANZ1_9BRAS|nr:unnamed protein product [Arabis nemorensis]